MNSAITTQVQMMQVNRTNMMEYTSIFCLIRLFDR